MKKFKLWLENKSEDFNPYPDNVVQKSPYPSDTESGAPKQDGPPYPKNKNLIPHTEKTQLQVKEVQYCIDTGQIIIGSAAVKLTEEQREQLKKLLELV
jgi:hypothetical protein